LQDSISLRGSLSHHVVQLNGKPRRRVSFISACSTLPDSRPVNSGFTLPAIWNYVCVMNTESDCIHECPHHSFAVWSVAEEGGEGGHEDSGINLWSDIVSSK
jgi:hypothetical protein